MNKVLIMCLFAIINLSPVYAQCRMEDYLLNLSDKKKEDVDKLFADSALSAYYERGSSPHFRWDKQKTDHIKAYNFKLHQYTCIDTYTDNYCSVYFRKDKRYATIIRLYFPAKDSVLCKEAYAQIIQAAATEKRFTVATPGSARKIVEVSNGQVLDLSHPTITPFYKFFLNDNRKESLEVRYAFSNRSQEYELNIIWLDKRFIE